MQHSNFALLVYLFLDFTILHFLIELDNQDNTHPFVNFDYHWLALHVSLLAKKKVLCPLKFSGNLEYHSVLRSQQFCAICLRSTLTQFTVLRTMKKILVDHHFVCKSDSWLLVQTNIVLQDVLCVPVIARARDHIDLFLPQEMVLSQRLVSRSCSCIESWKISIP